MAPSTPVHPAPGTARGADPRGDGRPRCAPTRADPRRRGRRSRHRPDPDARRPGLALAVADRPESARGLLHWVEARNHAIDLLEELGIPVDDDWPPYWK